MADEKQALGSTWYRLRRFSHEIEPRTVVKSTSQTVWYKDVDWNGNESARVTQERKGGDWFQTKGEAIAEMRKRLERAVQVSNDSYSRAVQALKNFNLKHAGRDCPPAPKEEQPA